jgi:UrcA family protein
MKTKIRFRAPARAALASIALFAPCGSSLAQPAADQPTPATEMVTVYAPFVVRHKPVGTMMSKNAGLELMSVSRTVSFHDLNLGKQIDADMLENRVHRAAVDACAELGKRFPASVYMPVPPKQDCVGNAVSGAMVSVKQLIAAANAN